LIHITPYQTDQHNNILHLEDGNIIEIPTGTYEIEDIKRFLKSEFGKYKYLLMFNSNENTLKVSNKSSVGIDFTQPNAIGSLLGFSKRKREMNVTYFSDNLVDIFKVNIIDVQSNVSSGSYNNGELSHSIYSFSPKERAGFKIHEVPNDVIYMPLDVSMLQNVTLKIVDQDGNLINFRGELVTVRLHIKRV
jgi:hypothetical protein